MIVEIWRRLLRVDDVSIDDDFFVIGGTSLLAARAISEIERAGRGKPALRELFAAPTVVGWAAAVDGAHPARVSSADD
jgi:syringomycin synthetase protein SyrE